MIIEIILVYILYLSLILLGNYYSNLFVSKDHYSKEEIKNIIPFFSQTWKKFTSIYNPVTLIFVFGLSSFIGIIIPMIFHHWVINSSVLFVLLFFILPYIKTNFEKSMVTQSEKHSDKLANIFIKYIDIIIIGFGTGLGTALIYNWRDLSNIYSLFFLINILIISIFLGYKFKNLLKE